MKRTLINIPKKTKSYGYFKTAPAELIPENRSFVFFEEAFDQYLQGMTLNANHQEYSAGEIAIFRSSHSCSISREGERSRYTAKLILDEYDHNTWQPISFILCNASISGGSNISHMFELGIDSVPFTSAKAIAIDSNLIVVNCMLTGKDFHEYLDDLGVTKSREDMINARPGSICLHLDPPTKNRIDKGLEQVGQFCQYMEDNVWTLLETVNDLNALRRLMYWSNSNRSSYANASTRRSTNELAEKLDNRVTENLEKLEYDGDLSIFFRTPE